MIYTFKRGSIIIHQSSANQKQMTSLKIVFGNQIHIQILANPQEITYELLQKTVARVFVKLPKKYTMHYLCNRTLTQINDRADILNWITKHKIPNEIQQIENATSFLKMYVLQATETNISTNKNQYQNDEQMIAEKFSEMNIQEEKKSSKKQLLLHQIKQHHKNEESQNTQPIFVDMINKESDKSLDAQVSEIDDQNQLAEKMNNMKIIQGTYSEQQQSQKEEQQKTVKRQHLLVKLEQEVLDQNRQQIKSEMYPKTKWAKHQVKKQDLPVHKNVVCNNCLKINIVGIRWKCTTCSDFDLCEKCEKSLNHQHDLIRIKKPKQKIVKQAPVFSQVKKEDYIEVEFPWKSKHRTKEQKKAMRDQKQQKLMGNQSLWNEVVAKALELSQLLDVPYKQCLEFSKQNCDFEFSDLIQIYYQKKNKSFHHQ